MHRIITVIAAITLVVTASCGGGGGVLPPQPTTTETKAVAGATVTAVTNVTGAALGNALQGLLLSASPIVLSATDVPESKYQTVSINYTYPCPVDGVAVATGTVDLSCSSNDSTVTCTVTNNTLDVEFQDCAVTETIDSTDYTLVLGDTVTTTFSGSGTGSESGLQSLSFSGTISGTASVSGDVTGTADLSNITYEGSGVPSPTVTCSGTAAVTTDSTTEFCSISSDCNSCQQ
ncbi:hypothetical protein KAR91_67580 [Candidatus Pacearchaeota archaeon]|nr:hypothetical protein [Candidatus Pacearchaeota archaeon]